MGRRPFAALAAVLLVPVVAVLSLSDRAPDAGLQVLSLVRRVGNRLVPDHPPIDLPLAPDLMTHLALWTLVGFVGHRLVAKRLSTITVLWLLVAASFAVEVAQVLFTTTRDMEATDLSANVFGVLIGVTASHLVTWLADLRSVRADRQSLGSR